MGKKKKGRMGSLLKGFDLYHARDGKVKWQSQGKVQWVEGIGNKAKRRGQ